MVPIAKLHGVVYKPRLKVHKRAGYGSSEPARAAEDFEAFHLWPRNYFTVMHTVFVYEYLRWALFKNGMTLYYITGMNVWLLSKWSYCFGSYASHTTQLGIVSITLCALTFSYKCDHWNVCRWSHIYNLDYYYHKIDCLQHSRNIVCWNNDR